jgi:hypothetical protein
LGAPHASTAAAITAKDEGGGRRAAAYNEPRG